MSPTETKERGAEVELFAGYGDDNPNAVVAPDHNRDPQDVVVGGDELVRRSLQQDASPQCRGWLPRCGRDEPVAVEPGQVHPRRQDRKSVV